MKNTSKKNPVLTSPWKIGMLVALLLMVVGFGASYFMVKVYDIELAWLEGSLLKWEVDSFAFFKEMYPLAAGVLLLSIVSYFTVASAVRRYRYFLNSGQDYRRLVQLADSIDDLTNPSQIARLKNYPELQRVLQNYGDQIRDISKQLSEQQAQGEHRCVDFEMEIDTLLQGETTQDSLVEDRWWTPLYRKVEAYIQESRRTAGEFKKKVHEGKTALGRVALSTGRIVEQIGGAAEEYPEILNSAGELNSLAKSLDRAGGGEQNSTKADKNRVKAVVKEMENTLHKLEDGGKVLNEFSEENNGLALNMALMAARGEVSEHDLAQFAEKVRSTADRFNRLSATFTSMAQGLLGSCYSLKEKLDVGAGPDAGETDEIRSSIASIAASLEDRCARLQERICCIGNEVHDVQSLVNRSIKSMSDEETGAESFAGGAGNSAEEEEEEMTIDRSGGRAEAEDGGELVIDHGRLWGDDADTVHTPSRRDESAAEGFPLDGAAGKPAEEFEAEQFFEDEPAGTADEPGEHESAGERESDDIPETEPKGEDREYVIPPADERSIHEALFAGSKIPSERAGEESVESPAVEDEAHDSAERREWFKIDIEREEEAAGAASEQVEVREAEDIVSGEIEAEEYAAADARGDEPADSAAAGAGTDESETEEGEAIFDLFDLGAVEYVEETISRG